MFAADSIAGGVPNAAVAVADDRFRFGELHHRFNLPLRSTQACIASGQPFLYEVKPIGMPRFWCEHVLTAVSEAARGAMRAGQAVLVVNDSMEGFPVVETLRGVSMQADAHDIPRDRIWLVTSNRIAHETASDWFASQGRDDRVRIVLTDFFRDQMAGFVVDRPDDFVARERALAAARDKTFLCFNRIPRVHRLLFVSRMIDRNIDENALLSFPPDGGQTFYQWNDDLIEVLRARAPLVVDQPEFDTNHATTHAVEPYLRTTFSVVTETLFFEDAPTLFYSEKIFKPIANHHPFVVLGTPGFLAGLRASGFRTFSPLVDERYDEEENDLKRLDMVLTEVERLSGLGVDVLSSWYRSVFDDLVHNRSVLATGTSSFVDLGTAIEAFLERGPK